MPTDKTVSSLIPPNTGPKVSEKSTKPELWAAYNQLLARLEGRDAEPSPELQAALAHDPSRSLVELKLKLSQQLDTLGEGVQTDIASLGDTRRAIKFERRQLLETQKAEQQQLSTEMANVRVHWKQEQQENVTERQREDDDYRYNLRKNRRSEEDVYSQKHAAREAALQAKEQAVAEREQHLGQLEGELAAWPKRLDDAVVATRSELGKEIEQQHATETRELKLIHQHEISLAAVKTQGLEQQLKGYTAEIDSLKRQLADASRQLKDMAVTVIEARSSEYRATDSRLVPTKPVADGRAE